MQKRIHLLAVLLILLATPWFNALPAQAQSGEVSFNTVLVDIWPEYDQPGVLVMYTLSISEAVALPVEVNFRIPVEAGTPHAVATRDVNGMFNLDYSTTVEGEWTLLTFTATLPDIRIEYYDPQLTITGDQRSFVYRWPADSAVNALTIQVQQPINATNMVFDPPMGTGDIAADGLTYYAMLAGSHAAGQMVDLKVNYQKPDSTLTNPNSFQPVQPSGAVAENAAASPTFNQLLPYLIGGLGLILIGLGLWWMWRGGLMSSDRQKPRRRHESASKRESVKDDGAYCHNCGRRAAQGDDFCRACGTKLR